MRVYGDSISGNCLKVRQILEFLNLDYDWQEVDILKAETRTGEFLALNPNGKVPTIVLDDGATLSESNAIISYLAEGSEWIPADRYLKAKMYEWLFFEQYSHEPYIAVCRFIQKYQGLPKEREAEYHSLKEGGNKALSIMESQLGETRFLVGGNPSLADIALFGYTHVAEEGGFNLEPYPNIRRWIEDYSSLTGFVGMPQA